MSFPVHMKTAATAKSLQSSLTLCESRDSSPPGFPVPGILQARTLEWVAISFSNVWKWKLKVKSLSHVRLFATPWTAAHQAPPSMGFSRQEYWSGLPLPFPEGRLSTWGKKKKIRVMIVKMIQNLGNKMEAQINRPEAWIKEMQGMFDEDLEELKI